jgi:hypothetical protein
MEESKVFKNVWRFNAIIIAVAGVLGVVVLIFATYMVIKETTGNRHRNDVVNVDPETKIEELFRLGRIQHVNGSDSVIVPLYSDQDFSLNYSGSKSTVSTRNMLFSNMRTETNSWLLPTNKYLISEHRLINESNSYNHDEEIVTVLYQVVKNDTNNDERLTSSDKLTIALSTPEGEKYTEVISDVDDVLGHDLLNKEAMAVMFNRNSQGYTVYINLTDFSVTKEIALPKIGSKL